MVNAEADHLALSLGTPALMGWRRPGQAGPELAGRGGKTLDFVENIPN